jgi:DNA-binding protein HU-beta
MAASRMKKSEVITRVAEAADVPRKTATKMLEALTDLAGREAKKGFALPGLGKLVLGNRKAPSRRSQRAGASAETAAKKVVDFRVATATREAFLGKPRSSSASTQAIPGIKALHDPETGRVDAARVARHLNESLAFMAAALRRNYSTVAKTPAAVSLQEPLRDFKRVIEVLEHVLGGAEGMRIWMNTPHPDLDGKPPREVIASGGIAIVRGMIDSSLSGNLT